MNDLLSFKFVLLSFLLTTTCSVFAIDPPTKSLLYFDDCDTCSGGANSGGILFGTFSGSDYIGVKYTHQRFESREGLFENSPKIQEGYNTMQLVASHKFSERIGASLVLPYQFHQREFVSSTPDQQISGVGDVSLAGFYKLWDQKKSPNNLSKKKNSKVPKQTIVTVGLNIKLPTGNYKALTSSDRLNPGFQVGSGSLDAGLLLSHTYKRKNKGVASSVNYFLKNENKNQYKFGNQLNIGSVVYEKLTSAKGRTVIPFVGFGYEHYANNKQYNELVTPANGGSILYGKLGSELDFGKVSLGANGSLPVVQKLKLDNFKANWQGSVFVNYSLGK